MEKENITVFGETTFRNRCQKFGIKTDDRRRHMYLIGKTGMGKSTILENMIIDDIYAGHGVAVVDPHGDLAEKVIEFIPDNRIDDVIYFNPADTQYPIAFNVIEEVGEDVRHLVASGLIGVFQKLWAESWGPRLEYILRNSILAVLDHPGATLLSITRMLSDKEFRADVVANVKDPVVKAFWVKEFAGYNDKFASEAVSPIQNKVGQFLSSSLIRNIVGQASSTIDMRKIMDERKILILNMSKGRIGEDNSMLLGAMIITKIQLAAMSRVDIEEKDRKDFYLYVDEFQNFTSDSFANILSEARKYRLNLVLAHQYIEQLTENVRNAVFGNVGTLIIFRVGAADAEALAPEIAPTFTDEDILNLPKYEIYLKLMIDGVASEPFSARGLPPKLDSEKTGNTERVIQACREKYTQDKASVEAKIAAWHETIGQPSIEKQKKKEELYKFSAKCSRCSKDTKTPFEPDGVRPVYCKDCLSILREEKNEGLEKRKEDKEAELQKLEKPRLVSNLSQSTSSIRSSAPALAQGAKLTSPPAVRTTQAQNQARKLAPAPTPTPTPTPVLNPNPTSTAASNPISKFEHKSSVVKTQVSISQSQKTVVSKVKPLQLKNKNVQTSKSFNKFSQTQETDNDVIVFKDSVSQKQSVTAKSQVVKKYIPKSSTGASKEPSLADMAKNAPTVSLNDLASMQPVGFRNAKKKQKVDVLKVKAPATGSLPKVTNSSPNAGTLIPKGIKDKPNHIDVKSNTAESEIELEEGSEVDFS